MPEQSLLRKIRCAECSGWAISLCYPRKLHPTSANCSIKLQRDLILFLRHMRLSNMCFFFSPSASRNNQALSASDPKPFKHCSNGHAVVNSRHSAAWLRPLLLSGVCGGCHDRHPCRVWLQRTTRRRRLLCMRSRTLRRCEWGRHGPGHRRYGAPRYAFAFFHDICSI